MAKTMRKKDLKIQILARNILMSRFHVGFDIELPLVTLVLTNKPKLGKYIAFIKHQPLWIYTKVQIGSDRSDTLKSNDNYTASYSYSSIVKVDSLNSSIDFLDSNEFRLKLDPYIKHSSTYDYVILH